MVRKQILGDWERRILEAYLKGERLKGYTALLSDIRKMGLKAIIDGCKHDRVTREASAERNIDKVAAETTKKVRRVS